MREVFELHEELRLRRILVGGAEAEGLPKDFGSHWGAYAGVRSVTVGYHLRARESEHVRVSVSESKIKWRARVGEEWREEARLATPRGRPNSRNGIK